LNCHHIDYLAIVAAGHHEFPMYYLALY